MKKILFTIFITITAVVGLLLTLLNTTNTVEAVINAQLEDKNISVESISGNLLSSLNIKNLRHNHQVVIKEMNFKWSPLALLHYRIDIDHIKIKDIDINATILLANAFANKEQNQTQADKSQFNPLKQWRVDVDTIAINGFYDQYLFDLKSTIVDGVGELNMDIDTPIVQDIAIKTQLDLKTLAYNGGIRVGEKVEPQYREILSYSNLMFEGDLSKVNLSLDSNYLKGSFVTQDFNHSIVTLYTKKDMPLKGIAPKKLEKLKVYFALTSSLHLQGIRPVFSYLDLKSNLLNLKLDGTYNDKLAFRGSLDFPKESLLRNYDKNLHFDNLGKIDIDMKIDEDYSVKLLLDSNKLHSKVDYANNHLDAVINIATQSISLKGDTDKELVADLKIPSLKTLLKSVRPIYHFDKIKLQGELFGKVHIAPNKEIEINVKSKKITFEKQKIENFTLNATSDIRSIKIKNYSLLYDKMKFFATKDSIITMKDSLLDVDSFWINDAMSIKGDYDLNSSKGKFDIHSDALKISHPSYVDTTLKSDVEVVVDSNKTKVDGVLRFLGGKVRYKPDSAVGFSLDKDIVIQQKKSKKAKESKLALNLSILSEKPFVYKNKDAQIQAKVLLQVTNGDSNDIKLYGMVEFVDWDSYYRLQNKKIRLYKQSAIHFIGEPTMPNLDIKAFYKGQGAEIEIIVVGDPMTPVLNFSSNPTMSREEILSVLLLDTKVGANANKTEDLQYLLGGALAKSFLSNLGLRVDHFVISDNKFEIGRKIGDKITIIYQGDEVSSVKVVYDYSKNVEADFIINKESSSMDIFYKGSL